MKTKIRPFHLAFPVYNIDTTIEWYVDILNCSIGRQSRLWVDFDFFGHQISAHKIAAFIAPALPIAIVATGTPFGI